MAEQSEEKVDGWQFKDRDDVVEIILEIKTLKAKALLPVIGKIKNNPATNADVEVEIAESSLVVTCNVKDAKSTETKCYKCGWSSLPESVEPEPSSYHGCESGKLHVFLKKKEKKSWECYFNDMTPDL